MKRILIGLSIVIGININVNCQNGMCRIGDDVVFPNAPFCRDGQWILVFEDEFNGQSIDEMKWYDVQPWGNYPSPAAVYLSEDVILDGFGNLLLRVKEWNHEYPLIPWDSLSETDFYKCSAGMIWSKPFFLYGKFELRCKINSGDGFWPAFWLFKSNEWQEIDIFEFYEKPTNIARLNVQYDLNQDGSITQWNGIWQDPTYWARECCQVNYSGPDFSNNFHVYTLEWDEFKIVWYLDGAVVREHYHYYDIYGLPVECADMLGGNVYLTERIFPDKPMQLIVNNGIYPEDLQIELLPSYMIVDYVKVWKRESGCCISDKRYEGTSNLPDQTWVTNSIIAGFDAGVDNYSGAVTVQSNQDVSFYAGNNIILKDGFVVNSGAHFISQISGCDAFDNLNNQITCNNLPDEFSPDGDGIDDYLMVSVNGATSYDIAIDDYNWPHTRYYYRESVPIFSDPVCVWDGTCDYGGNCLLYHKCNRQRKISLKFKNCTNSLITAKTIYVNCNNRGMEIKDTNDIYGQNQKGEFISEKPKINNIGIVYFYISPNPCDEEISFNYLINNASDLILNIYNSIGDIVKSTKLSSAKNKQEIITNEFSNGIYTFQLKNSEVLIRTGRFVVIH